MSPVPTMERASGTARHPDHETSYPNGDDLRRDPLEVRKATLASIVVKASSGIRFKRPDGLRPCLQDGAGGHRVEAQGLTLPLRALAGLVEDEKPGVCGGDARGGGRLELEHGRTSAISPSLVPRPMIFDVMKAKDNDAADIVCDEYKGRAPTGLACAPTGPRKHGQGRARK